MLKKKSYMNSKNILSEGFFSKIFKMLKISKTQKDQIKKSKEIHKSIKDLNSAQSNLEDALEDYVGKKVKLNRYTLKDFL